MPFPIRRRLFTSLCLVSLLLFCRLAWAGSVTLVLSGREGPYREFAESFQENLKRGNWNISARNTFDAIDFNRSSDLYIAVGQEALGQLITQNTGKPVLAVLVTKLAFEKQLDKTASKVNISAIYLDQPLARQAAFVKQLLPNANRVGLLTRSDAASQNQKLKPLLSSQGLRLETEDVDNPITFLPALNALLPRVDVLLTLPDSQIIARDQIRPLLMTALRHQRPVIAYSQAMVNAGALGALHSTPLQIGQQAAELVSGLGDHLPPPLHPAYYTIHTNRAVADAFNLEMRDEAVIRRALSRFKDAP